MLNRLFAAILLLCIYSSNSAAADCKDKSVPYHEVNNGVETIICGLISEEHPKLGKIALPNATAQFTRIENGKFIYSKDYSTNKYGMRKSSVGATMSKQKHFLYIDGSVAFGEGLNDNETTTHWINLKSKTYQAYAVGYQGYHDQHTWLQFEQGDLPQKIKQKIGRAMLISYDFKIDLLAAHRQTLPILLESPNIREDKNGIFKYVGNFADTTTYLNKFLISFCLPMPACKSFLFSNPDTIDEGKLDFDAARLARFYSSIDKFYREQFEVEEFVIAWTGTHEGMLRMQKYLTIPIVELPKVEQYPDNHPTPKGAKDWAQFILETQLQH